MALHDLILVWTAYVIALATPGPNNMAIMHTAMRYGRSSSLALAAGVLTMTAVWGLLAATGMSTLLTNYAHAIKVLKFGGGLYLMWLAWKAARSAATPHTCSANLSGITSPSAWNLYRRGVLVNAGNPKAVLTWMAIMSLGIRSDATPAFIGVALGGCIILGLAVFVCYAKLFSTPLMVRSYAKSRRWFEGLLAAFFASAGIRLLVSR